VTYRYPIPSPVLVFSSGVSSMPVAPAGRFEPAASAAARSRTVSPHLGRGTASSTSRHCTALRPPTPSDLVAK
jgi:hypothetical protein